MEFPFEDKSKTNGDCKLTVAFPKEEEEDPPPSPIGLEEDQNHPGDDLPGMPLSFVEGASAPKAPITKFGCGSECAKNKACVGWVFDETTKKCWLKGQWPSVTTTQNKIDSQKMTKESRDYYKTEKEKRRLKKAASMPSGGIIIAPPDPNDPQATPIRFLPKSSSSHLHASFHVSPDASLTYLVRISCHSVLCKCVERCVCSM